MGLAKSIIEVYEAKNPRVQFLPGSGTSAARMSHPNRWMDALTPMADGLPGWSCTTRCADLIRTVPEVPWDEKDPEVEDGKSENHAYEGVGRFFEARPFAPRAEVVDPYQDLDPLSRAHHQAQDKRLEGGKFGDVPQLYVKM